MGYKIKKGLIWVNEEYSDMQGPAPSGFHVPLISEWEGLNTIMSGLGLTTGDNWRTNLHIPFAGRRQSSNANINSQGSIGYYWSSSTNNAYARHLNIGSSYVNVNDYNGRAYGFPVRCFKDSFKLPTSSWAVIVGTLGSAGIFWNQTEGLISITSDGTTGYTIQDKNLGATTVYLDGATLSEANCGKYYQWGNNYGFAWTGSVTTSSTQVNAQNYGPGTYYSSRFVTGFNDWSSVQNDNLRGGVSQGSGTRFVTKSFYPNPLKTYSEIFDMAIAEGPQWINTIAELNSLKKTYYMNFSDLLVQKYERQTGGTVYAIDGVYETVDVGTMYDKYRRLGYSTDYGHNGWGAIICNS